MLALGSGALLVASRLLTPSASGVGTHMQLGLPACGFLVLFGKPCPACGLTTAFAHLAHGSLLASLHANPLGLPLFLATLALLVVSLRGLYRQRPMASLLQGPMPLQVAVGISVGLLLVWAVRLAS